MSKVVETDVLIVGAGPSGAVASALLADLGVRNIMINKYKSTSPGPRSHITNQRAMEILRDLGLEEPAKALAVPHSYMAEQILATSVTGEEFGRILAWANHPIAKGEHELASPCTYCDLPQLYFEPLVVNAASLRGSDVRFQTEYLSLEQDANGVTSKVLDRINGAEYEIRAKYLIGADGARSKVAQDIQLPFEGQMGLGESGSINIEFEADLTAYLDHRRGDMIWAIQAGSGINGTGVSVLRMVRPWNKFVCVTGYEFVQGTPTLDNAEATKMVHKLLGTDEIPVIIEAVSFWTINQQNAVQNTRGRVFCMGDAVHRHTPMHGLGLNTSVQDSYNLCWKIALVVKGQATPKLLESYDSERSPIAKQLVERAYKSMSVLPPLYRALGLPAGPTEKDLQESLKKLKGPAADGAKMRAELRKAIDDFVLPFGGGHGIELNQRYTSGAIVSDGSADPGFVRDKEFYYQASSRPGAHLPHVWLTKDQRRVSTLDLCGKGRFTLLTGLSGRAWVEAAAKVSAALNLDIRVHVIGPGQEYADTYGDFSRLRETEESGALLVRPDMFVGWRAFDGSAGNLVQLSSAVKCILGME
ncbi:MAG: FAD-dependent monooxygenase [Thauera sp.]|jgi:2,4-dichlorophenol 6-monooxygenase|nr:FAD-dependent monooxygenase [Thauera sp.]